MRVLALTSPKPLKTIKGKTLVQQGVDLTFGNWRGILAPTDLSDADYLNTVKLFDILHASPSWKDTLVAKSWIDEYRAGDAFSTWIKKENSAIIAVLQAFNLIK
jgi:putative tricarboxylic transport membrane protein